LALIRRPGKAVSTKIAGRYRSPYLAALDGADPVDDAIRPDGHPVELDLERDLPAAADAHRQATLRGDEERARLARRRAEARGEPGRTEARRSPRPTGGGLDRDGQAASAATGARSKRSCRCSGPTPTSALGGAWVAPTVWA
jgi:hypothetical protein